MASQVPPPSSSSPTRADPSRQQHAWPASSEPPPKRRRKGPDPQQGQVLTPGRARQPHVKPHARRPLADFTLLYRRASNPAKGPAKVAADGPGEIAAIGHRQTPVAASTTFHNTPRGWSHGPATTPPSGSHRNWAPPPPLQPAWTYAQGSQPWMNHSSFDLSPTNPLLQHHYQGSWHQNHAYNVPTQTQPFVGHASQVHHTGVTGTADRPILLDDSPVQPVLVPAAPAQTQRTQGLGGGMHFQPGFDVEDKENTVSHQAGYGRHMTYDPKGAFPDGAARGSSKPGPPVQPQDKKPEPSRESQPGPARDEPELCPEQAELVSLIEQGSNVFYTGSAGCGKSTVLKAFVRRLRDSGKKVRIIAPTGRAALNVGGSTTWTFAGWTPSSHKLPIDKIKQGAHGKNVYRRLSKTDVLVIDEISMVENLHLERLNILMKTARHNPALPVQPAFGGCQIVVTGDFCQLPPVKPFQHCLECGRELTTKVNDIGKLVHACKLHGEYADEDKWAFRSNAWGECNFVHFHLKTIHRQNDQKFIRMLQKCRLGHRMSESEISLLMNHQCRVSQATKLYSTRKEASDVNRAAFNQLKGVKYAYWCHDNFFLRECHPHLQRKGVRGEWHSESEIASPPDTKRPLYALEDHRWAKCVELKRGMLVVLLTNLDLEAGLCNGSQGVICSFEDYDPKKMPMKDTTNARGRKKIEPLPGQRVLRGEHAAVQESEIKNFILSESAPVKKWPVVRFHNGIKRTVYAECSISQLGDEEPYSLLVRTQIPLAPAWAMTIHKSQSLTLDRCIVNLSKAFEDGQVYVALSRATGLNGLKIEGDGDFLRNKLMVNPEVAAFLKEKFGDIYGATESDDEEPVPQ